MATYEELQVLVDEQAVKVRNMKAEKADKMAVKEEVSKLLELKKKLEAVTPKEDLFDRASFEDLMKRRFFYAPAFEVYGGVAGLYDYGPIGCAVKANLLALWRQMFLVEDDNILEIDSTAMTPEPVLVASGHVARFTDIMVRDTKTGECLRADHLLEEVMVARAKDPKATAEQKAEYMKVATEAENFTLEELAAVLQKYEIKSPATGNDLTEPGHFNMMFATSIGPTGTIKGYLRPETAQGIFLCFKRLLEFNNYRLPFGGAQIGKAFRNEICPRQSLLRVREFEMAEIEFFHDPIKHTTDNFKKVEHLEMPFWNIEAQLSGKNATVMNLKEAHEKGVVANQTHAYFLGRIYEFMLRIGIKKDKIRFRQHLPNEMAHYANDCWDCELLTSYGWVECVGCANRSCYDLECHAKFSGQSMFASEVLKEPIVRNVTQALGDKGKIGKDFKKDAKLVFQYLENMTEEEVNAFEAKLKEGPVTFTSEGKEFTLDSSMVKVETKEVKEFERKFLPNVIEPSFGIGRILYALLEQTYDVRENDAKRGWFDLPPTMAPVKCSLLPLSNNAEFQPHIDKLRAALSKAGLTVRVDDSSAAIGKRYARTDEIAIPFGITIDFDTCKDDTATVRERNSMEQVRMKVDEIPKVVSELSTGARLWADVVSQYGLTVTGADSK